MYVMFKMQNHNDFLCIKKYACINVIYQYSLTFYTSARRHTETAVNNSHSQCLIQGNVNSGKVLVNRYPASYCTLQITIYKFNY